MLDINYEETADLELDLVRMQDWFNKVIVRETKRFGDICIIFCSDDYLLEINQQHLNHDYFTDIVTFDYTVDDEVGGDLFISVDRIRDNAEQFGVSFEEELFRVCIHGVLHLCGYKDKSESEELLMREKENQALALLGFT
jgi:rRNA maturation RNase YbeY